MNWLNPGYNDDPSDPQKVVVTILRVIKFSSKLELLGLSLITLTGAIGFDCTSKSRKIITMTDS
jgi:hypothetical protein